MLKIADLAVREDFSLGPLRVRPALRSIKGPAGEVHVEPLIMQVFLLLVDAKGQVVTRNRLFDECWGGVIVGDDSLNRAITMVRRIAADTGPGAFLVESIPRTGYRLLVDGAAEQAPATARSRRGPLIGAVLIVLLALAVVTLSFWTGRPHEPTIVLAPTDSRSAELARGIGNAAITSAAEYQAAFKLLEDRDPIGSRADFVLKVNRTGPGREQRIDLALVSNADKSLLWSWSEAVAQEMAQSLERKALGIGAAVVTCAAETRNSGSRPPSEATVKLYLDACARFEPWAGAQLKLLPDAFQKITAAAPQLRGAWSKLFLSKAEAIEGWPPVDLVESLKKDIQEASRHGIELPETYIAKAAVLSLNARYERLQLYEAGLERYPSSPYLLAARSWQLRSLGRMDEAAKTAQRLASLYPQSPAANTEYANSLMFSGRIEEARSVLERALKAAPDAANLRRSLWLLEHRYGDPKVALGMARKGEWVVDAATISFVEARIHPTKANVDHAIEALMGSYRAEPRAPDFVAQAMGTFGRNEDAIRLLLAFRFGDNSGDGAEMLFRPPMKEIRRDLRFMHVARIFGVTDYWKKSGILPDYCYEPNLPYDCKQELAKLRT